MKVVIDTNVVASAIFFGGRPREILELLIMGKIEAYASRDILNEYRETIEELCLKYNPKAPTLALNTLFSVMNVVKTSSNIEVCRDPDDKKFLECAVDAGCIYIVSGDKDLLSIGEYEGVQILTASDFLKTYGR